MNNLKDMLSPRQLRKFNNLRRFGAELVLVNDKVQVIPPLKQQADGKFIRTWNN